MVATACLVMLVGVGAAGAHETETVGPLRLSVGWGDEPALVGALNHVQVTVTDLAGAPVNDPAATLTVEVIFGAEKATRALASVGGSPGRYEAALIPTRAGTYAFRVHGAVRGTNIDITSTCSDRTFDCAKDPDELQFPAKDPSTGQLAARLDRELARQGDASKRDPLVIVAVAIAAAALALAAATTARGARKH